jgi:hypothetical protein
VRLAAHCHGGDRDRGGREKEYSYGSVACPKPGR